MAWDQLAIDKPHVAYLILGGFTSLFMLCSLFVKEKLYIGEATVATICGVIFGPHAANLLDPGSWGNVDKITLECSRIVLVVQCFAVGVELPKAYMERHWRSVIFLLVPVMTFGWLITSIFIWWMIVPLTWLESLAVAACVTATDPVLASSVVGKGKFSKRVPKHLRDVLSAESGCNDGMAFPFIYLSLYLIRYNLGAQEVVFHWACLIILYECLFGAFYGFMVGYIARHAIKLADRYGFIDRESFLVFYFVLALFCAGSGSLLGMDDLLIGFSAGVGFSNDGWFTHKTEESHVSNVIDLLLNLAYFVYLGSIVPWDQFNNEAIGLQAWRLVVIAIMVIFFRRIPAMMALKPLIPDVKNWREALFAGHFGPIGVGAIFAAILARAELETDSTQPLAVVPTDPNAENFLVVQVIWPVVTFLVISSIMVHGSSIAVFTLGKHINTLTLTMSYTQANDPSWLNRLPRISSVSRSMSRSKADDEETDADDDEKLSFPPGTLGPVGFPGNFLRRQREEDNPSRAGSRSGSRASSLRPSSRRKKHSSGEGYGGPISQSAITPQRRPDMLSPEAARRPSYHQRHSSDTKETISSPKPAAEEFTPRYDESPPERVESASTSDDEGPRGRREKAKAPEADSPESEAEVEAYQEGDHMVVEDEEGNVLRQFRTRGESDAARAADIEQVRNELKKETSGEHAKHKGEPHTRETPAERLKRKERDWIQGESEPAKEHVEEEGQPAGNDGMHLEKEIIPDAQKTDQGLKKLSKRLHEWNTKRRQDSQLKPVEERLRGPAHAYQYGNTIIVEDEDGEVVKKYDIPARERQKSTAEPSGQGAPLRKGLQRMGTWTGLGSKPHAPEANPETVPEEPEDSQGAKEYEDDDRIRFRIGSGTRRMSKHDFIKQIQSLDPKAKIAAIQESGASHEDKHDVAQRTIGRSITAPDGAMPQIGRMQSHKSDTGVPSSNGKAHADADDVPHHSVTDSLARFSLGKPETAAQKRRRQAAQERRNSDDGDTEGIPPESSSRPLGPAHPSPETSRSQDVGDEGETAAERRRRLAALGEVANQDSSSDSDDDGGERQPRRGRQPVPEPKAPSSPRMGVRFADLATPSQARSVQWAEGYRDQEGTRKRR